LTQRGSVDCISVRRHVIDFKRDDVAATQLAVDRLIEHREVARSPLYLKLGPDRP
jgi:hypothetical protein